MLFSVLVLITVAVVCLCGGILVGSWLNSNKKIGASEKNVQLEYFKGLNFVLNEQPDKAIEVFIKALEVDSETVELHFALAGLFRRKGQVDRATRIHQNLIARPSLTTNQRAQAIYELAQDYYHAGLFDRAENLLLELKESTNYRFRAIESLVRLYQIQKDWQKAIDISSFHKRSFRQQFSLRWAHFWCELAEVEVSLNNREQAQRYLKNAQAESTKLPRAIYLKAKLSFMCSEYKKALSYWHFLLKNQRQLLPLFIKDLLFSYRVLEETKLLQEFLVSFVEFPQDEAMFSVLVETMEQELDPDFLVNIMMNFVSKGKIHIHVYYYLLEKVKTHELSHTQIIALLQSALVALKTQQAVYSCQQCGYSTKMHHWQCPQCSHWDSVF